MKIIIQTVTYNRAGLLERTINSVLNQSFTDFEYLIVNNGSTDNTNDLINEYCKKDSRVKTISFSKNRIDSVAFKKRYELLNDYSAPYFMRIDDDDYMELNTVDTLYNLIMEHDADAARVGSRYVYPDGSMKNKFVFDGIYVYNRIEAMTEMLKREKFNSAIGGTLLSKNILNFIYPDINHVRDIHISYRRMNNVQKMVVSGEPLYYFYRHDKNMSGLDSAEQITPEKINQHLEANTMRTQWLSEHMPEIKNYVFYCELSFMISLYERIHRLEVKDCFGIADEMKDILQKNISFLLNSKFCTIRENEILISL